MALGARLLEHWQLKVLAVVLAAALWLFAAAAEDRGEAVHTVHVRLVAIPSGLTVTALEDETVDVRVRGRRGVLARLRERDLQVEVSLRDARPGGFVARVSPANIVAPRGVQVLRVAPSRVRGTLAETRGTSG